MCIRDRGACGEPALGAPEHRGGPLAPRTTPAADSSVLRREETNLRGIAVTRSVSGCRRV
eukprot:14967463-Alexandrium_andersonii.AAC.1